MRRNFMTMLAVLSVCLTVAAQGQEPTYEEKEVYRSDDVIFRQIDEHTWEGNGHLMFFESLYLIEGNERAVLLDAGTKIKDLKKIVESITSKPVTLIATHVHPDHTGDAIHDFPEIYLNAADTVNMPQYMPNYKGTIKYLKEGEIIDLGGRQLEVIFTPGHTPGSTSFMDKEAGYGFTADAFGSGNLLLFMDFPTELATCKKMDEYITKHGIKYMYPGHYAGVNKETPQRIKDMITLCEDVLSGKRTGEKLEQAQLGLDMAISDFGVRIVYSSEHVK